VKTLALHRDGLIYEIFVLLFMISLSLLAPLILNVLSKKSKMAHDALKFEEETNAKS
jgi:hypothetical protein